MPAPALPVAVATTLPGRSNPDCVLLTLNRKVCGWWACETSSLSWTVAPASTTVVVCAPAAGPQKLLQVPCPSQLPSNVYT